MIETDPVDIKITSRRENVASLHYLFQNEKLEPKEGHFVKPT